MKISSYHVLRVGMAITFLWIGVLLIKSPNAFAGLLKPWAIDLIPNLNQAMLATAVLDILIGLSLLVGRFVVMSSLLGIAHLAIVIATTGLGIVTVRDIGLLAGMISILITTYPSQSLPRSISELKAILWV